MKNLYIWFIILIAIALLVTVGFYQQDKPLEVVDYTVSSGDTLDGIYYQYGINTVPLLKWRYEVKKLNGMDASGLAVGEVVKIYVEGVER